MTFVFVSLLFLLILDLATLNLSRPTKHIGRDIRTVKALVSGHLRDAELELELAAYESVLVLAATRGVGGIDGCLWELTHISVRGWGGGGLHVHFGYPKSALRALFFGGAGPACREKIVLFGQN